MQNRNHSAGVKGLSKLGDVSTIGSGPVAESTSPSWGFAQACRAPASKISDLTSYLNRTVLRTRIVFNESDKYLEY
jgi:hypothetical protein